MASTTAGPDAKRSGRHRPALIIVAGALVLGLAAGLLSYLDSALVIGPDWRAGTEELRQRGARIYFESCAGFSVEPRFWPECVGDADEKRERGATKLVEFCTGLDRYVRFFGPQDCLAEDRPPLTMASAPSGVDLAAGGLAAGAALAGLAVLAVASGAVTPGERHRADDAAHRSGRASTASGGGQGSG